MDKSEMYGIYLLLWLILANVITNKYSVIAAGVIAMGYGIASIYQNNKEDKNK
jgi:hypothetical protein